MTISIDDEKYQDLVFQGVKEAGDLERQRLREEGHPILVWRDGKVVDISQELQLQEPSPCQNPEL